MSSIFKSIKNKSYGELLKASKEGVDFNIKDKEGRTPLLLAIEMVDHTSVELLLGAGADPNLEGNEVPIAKAIQAKNELENSRHDHRNHRYGGHTGSEKNLEDAIKIIGSLLSNGANVNVLENNGNPLLFKAIDEDNRDLASLLLGHGANVNIKNKKGQSSLVYIVEKRDLQDQKDWISLFIGKGADINLVDNEGKSPLLIAFDKNDEEIIQFLIEKGADVNVIDKNGKTPLLYVLKAFESSINEDNYYGHERNDKVELIKLLLNKGADVNVIDKNGKTPLLYVLKASGSSINEDDYYDSYERNDKVELIKLLIKLLLNKGADVNIAGSEGYTPLFMAIAKQDKDIVSLLVEKGAKVTTLFNGRPILDYALAKGQLEIVNILVGAGADLDVISAVKEMLKRCQKKDNSYPQYLKIVINALTENKGIEDQDADGKSILHILSKEYSMLVDYSRKEDDAKNLFQLALDKIPQVNKQDNKGKTPLHFAYNKTCVSQLLSKGADPNVQDEQGRSSLHLFYQSNNKENTANHINNVHRVHLLLGKGADPNLQDKEGRTPLHYVALSGSFQVGRILLSMGGNLNLADKKEITPYQIASMLSNLKIMSGNDSNSTYYNEDYDDDDY